MSLELALIVGLILHFVGDYIFQSDWMAINKTKAFYPAFIHASIYSLPFLVLILCRYMYFHINSTMGLLPSPFLTPSVCWLILFGTHYFIDRYRLATYWIQFINGTPDRDNFGYSNDKPAYVAFWLMVIIDNSFHIIINSLCIFFST